MKQWNRQLGHPRNEDISLNPDTVYGPSYIEMCVNLNEDTSFNQDTVYDPSYIEIRAPEMRTPPLIGTLQGVQNRKIPLYSRTCRSIDLHQLICILYTALLMKVYGPKRSEFFNSYIESTNFLP